MLHAISPSWMQSQYVTMGAIRYVETLLVWSFWLEICAFSSAALLLLCVWRDYRALKQQLPVSRDWKPWDLLGIVGPGRFFKGAVIGLMLIYPFDDMALPLIVAIIRYVSHR